MSSPSDRDLDDSSVSRTTPLLPVHAHGDGRRAGHAGDAELTAADRTGAVEQQHPATDRQARVERPARPALNRASSSGSSAGESRLPPGTMLAGRYRIMQMLGRGGMGEVYCAHDIELGQSVAIKLLPEKYQQDPARLERLRSEVRMARSVTHAHVCRVYDLGKAEGRSFLSMELIEGEDLDALLRRIGRLTSDRMAEIGIQICQGLAAIHDNGILHRDLKPANIMLDARGRVRIADFGLASVAEQVAEQDALQGTPAYMAPEQITAQQVSSQSDIYALGLILYRLLTGKSATELYRMRAQSAPPPPSTLVEGVPPAFDAIILRCLAPDPRLRPASARAVANALAGATPGQAAALVVAVASTALDRPTLAARCGDEATERVTQAYAQMLDALCRQYGGTRVPGDGEALVVFAHPGDAVHHALAHQRAVQALAQREGVALAIGVGIHLGVRPRVGSQATTTAPVLEVDATTRDVATRLGELAGPGQILLTRSVFDLARQDALSGHGKILWLAHGSYELAGMAEPVEVCEVGAEGVAPLAPPVDSEVARRRRAQDVIAGWRPAPGMELPEHHARQHWRMQRKLGEGGFGEVWLAEHAMTHERRVFKFCYDAEKLRALQREITLFRLLKETLGDRSDIVRILDWSFDRAPYFVESAYTAGGNLIEWADAQGGLPAIPLATRLEIVAQVATALAAAHSVGVLHKDVKPGNVLMATDIGAPAHAQLGDFGIGAITEKERLARAGITAIGLTVDARTDIAAAAPGTRLYMAPELLEGKPATTQADIYALGVVLYQIAVGDFARALAPGWERDIEDELVRADVAAAVDGDPARRLDSAAQLAERLATLDQRRQELVALRHELAERERQHEVARQAQAALARGRRRRRLLALAAGVFALFAGVVTVQSLRLAREARAAERARQTAELERRTAEQVSGFLVELFEEADPQAAQGRDISAREVLDRSKVKIDALAGQPEVQARLMHVMGVVYGSIGLYQEAAALLERAVEKRRQLHGSQHVAVADSLHELASAREHLQSYAPAEQAAREAMALRRTLLGGTHVDTAATMEVLADVLMGLGNEREAEGLYQESLAIRRQAFGPAHAKVAQSLRRLGTLHLMRGQNQDAARRYQESLDMYRGLPGDHSFEIAKTTYYVGLAQLSAGQFVPAETLLLESLAANQKLLGDEHPMVATVMDQLASLYQRTGRYDQAEPLLHALLALHRKIKGDDSLAVASTLRAMAFLARAQADCARTQSLSLESLNIHRKALGSEHPLVATTLANHAHFLASWGDLAGAVTFYRDALAMFHRLGLDQEPLIAALQASLADTYIRQGDLAQASPVLTRAHDLLQRQPPEETWLLAHVDSVRGAYASKSGDLETAERLLRDAHESMRNVHGAHMPHTKQALARLIAFYDSVGRAEAADRYRQLPIQPPCVSQP